MKKTLLLLSIILCSANLLAQSTETVHIDWEIGSAPSLPESDPRYPNKTIEDGDTVIWTWTDGMTHNVHNKSGAVESFDSGFKTGVGQTYSYTFTVVGDNPYQCDPHANNMFGTITVVPDGSLGIEGANSLINTSIYPTHVVSVLNVELPQSYSELTVEVYNVLGKRIKTYSYTNIKRAELELNDLNAGMYLIKLSSSESTITKRFIKQ
ncbi:T9SS type A sorting domain-containing protein [Mesonia sp. K7]|uniref:T9SS type A sorting domain-containing protein n=1 Tax=Mesonia sp. K7 TaxID=2218606 RepID=UPI000DA8F8EC|nr:T9SS type A sorting domain-containing protein [Mesonia sp. K7]PZD77895.1 hypothetical protein DNG35_07315 [Mesonia sp. K7]